jgi:cytochrome c-type biogenesis protein CcmE
MSTTAPPGSPAVDPSGDPGGDHGSEPPLPLAPVRPATRRHRTRLRLAVVAVILVGALVFLLVEGLGSSLNYFDTVDQALAHKAALGTGTVRLEGVVVPKSVVDTPVGTDFTIAAGGHSVRVDNTGTPPQLFQPNIPVVVVGHFASVASDTFVSDAIMVKHSANYIAQHPARVKAPDGSVR